MTTQLAILALLGALNSGRTRASAPMDTTMRGPALVACLGALVALIVAFSWLSDPILDTLGVSEPNARIAAGIALLVVAAHDLFGAAPTPEPGLSGPLAGLVPMAFPVAFTPASAALAIAIGVDHGVVTTVGVAIPALAVVAVVTLAPIPSSLSPWVTRFTAMLASVVGILVTLDGVRSI